MESSSEKFRKIVFEVFTSSKRVLGVIHQSMRNLFSSREDIEILEVNLNNHKEILEKCKALIRSEKN